MLMCYNVYVNILKQARNNVWEYLVFFRIQSFYDILTFIFNKVLHFYCFWKDKDLDNILMGVFKVKAVSD